MAFSVIRVIITIFELLGIGLVLLGTYLTNFSAFIVLCGGILVAVAMLIERDVEANRANRE